MQVSIIIRQQRYVPQILSPLHNFRNKLHYSQIWWKDVPGRLIFTKTTAGGVLFKNLNSTCLIKLVV